MKIPIHGTFLLLALFGSLTSCSTGSLGDATAPEPMASIIGTPTDRVPVEQAIREESTDRERLQRIWTDADVTDAGPYQVVRRCRNDEGDDRCSLTVTRRGKTLFRVESMRPEWLRYGFFRFLKGTSPQLVVHSYSGGAHCCYDYFIFDLGARFRTLYDSTGYDSGNEIGNKLVPVDLDRDETYEFYQDVMAFDYVGFGGHASATFPPAIFRYNKGPGKFELANKQFPQFVLAEMEENLAQLQAWKSENQSISEDDLRETAVRDKFLYLVYAGRRDEGWEFFLENYRTESGDKYQDQFRDKFRREFAETFQSDPTYRSIYGR